jgi:hypothetical protein
MLALLNFTSIERLMVTAAENVPSVTETGVGGLADVGGFSLYAVVPDGQATCACADRGGATKTISPANTSAALRSAAAR